MNKKHYLGIQQKTAKAGSLNLSRVYPLFKQSKWIIFGRGNKICELSAIAVS